MGLRIFDTDPDAKPAPQTEKTEYDKPAYSFRTGMLIPDPKNPKKDKGISLPKWRAVTDNESIAQGIAELFGGTAEEFDPTKEQNWHVLTDAESVEVVIDGSKAVEDKLVQWGGVGGPIHECDGEFSLLPEDKGEPCGCPTTMKERKALASKNRGPKPAINVDFILVGAGEELGKGKLIATDWTLAGHIHEVKAALDEIDGPAICDLRRVHVEYMHDVHGLVSYHHVQIDVKGSYNDAIAEER
jgi:hypothetical protein